MERKIHDTIKREVYKYKPVEVRIHVVNTTEYELEADVFFDIDEFKITISKKKV